GLEAEAGTAERDFAFEVWPANGAAAADARSCGDPVIDAPAGIADAAPDFAHAEAGEQFLLDRRFPRRIGLGQVIDAWGTQSDDAVAGGHHAIARGQPISEDTGANDFSLFVGFEPADGAVGLFVGPRLRFPAGRDAADGRIELALLVQFDDVVVAVQVVAVDLADIDVAAGVEAEAGWFGEVRLGGHQLNAKTF